MFNTKGALHLLCYVAAIYIQSVSGAAVIENTKVLFEFDETTGSLSKLIDKSSADAYDLIGMYTNAYPLWDVTFVDSVGTVDVDNVGRAVQYKLDKAFNIQTLALSWKSITVIGRADESIVDVNLVITLIDDSSVSYWSIGVDVVNGTSIGIWQAKVSIPFTVGNDDNGELFFPSGYGTLYSHPVKTAGGGVSSNYPGSGATMQFMAMGSRDGSSGGYVAALDSNAEPKQLQYFTSAVHDSPALVSETRNEVYDSRGPRLGEVQSFPLRNGVLLQGKEAPIPKLSFLSVTIYPRDAGVAIAPGAKWVSSYLLAVGVVSGVSSATGRPLWFEASSVYRGWALADAKWTKKGPFHSRADPALPEWYRSNSIWLNTHWQCHDIFNATGGDPSFVAENTKALADALGQSSIALHWYEWQQGPDPAPDARYKFDTHYPDYFPPRSAFRDAVKDLRDTSGVYTVPYINGRIFDIKSDSYLADDGDVYCTKYLKDVKRIDDKNNIDLVSYEETYGSDASFCVANPYSPYWQGKLADTVDELVNDWEVDGVYIDQIGSAGPKMCWDDAHGHTLGGGSWWRDGYEQMLDAIAARTAQSDGAASAPIVTEDNAEPYMDSLQGYLTLVAFKASLQQQSVPSSTGYKQLVPAFPAVYGGYFVGFGAQWYQLDFDDHDWWRGKLAATFVTGTQMGWFSITGKQILLIILP
jgi:hypothetical protein